MIEPAGKSYLDERELPAEVCERLVEAEKVAGGPLRFLQAAARILSLPADREVITHEKSEGGWRFITRPIWSDIDIGQLGETIKGMPKFCLDTQTEHCLHRTSTTRSATQDCSKVWTHYGCCRCGQVATSHGVEFMADHGPHLREILRNV